jgi:alkylated DNA repair dioxygenase AlkB
MTLRQTIVEDAPAGARVTYQPSFLGRQDADALLAWMLENTPWQLEAPVVFGKAHPVLRRTFAYGAPGLSYRYSGVERPATAWPAPLLRVVARLQQELTAPFNFGLCNLYPDGHARIGKHADAEADIVRDSPIAGLSLGATRDFVLHERDSNRTWTVPLVHGSLLVMWGSTQRRFKHSVPARVRVTQPRVNVTFRVLRS